MFNNGKLTNEEISQFEEFKEFDKEKIESLIETYYQIGRIMFKAFNQEEKQENE